MAAIWATSLRKFTYWLLVELSVLRAREKLGQIPDGTAERIRKATWMDEKVMKLIELRDREIQHDLNAFVEIMRLQMILGRDAFEKLFVLTPEAFQTAVTEGLARQGENADAGWFHDGMTSYDTEEPAMALLYRDACGVTEEHLEKLLDALSDRCLQHRDDIMMGRTHGQHAQPITFGIKCLGWYDMVRRAMDALIHAREQALVMKLSGAVGIYGTLGPEVEDSVGVDLDLTPVIAIQIVPLDYRVRVVAQLAILAGVLKKIVNDLWLMSQTEVGEVREPFGKMQKGSSAMPQKKNPIKLENLRGCADTVFASFSAMLQQIATSHERDISHSSVERTDGVDAFGMTDRMVSILTQVVTDMEVFPERLRKNIDLSFETWASQRVEMFLKAHGMAAEAAYRLVQRACFEAMQKGELLSAVLTRDTEVLSVINQHNDEYYQCFDPQAWITHVSFLYQRTLHVHK